MRALLKSRIAIVTIFANLAAGNAMLDIFFADRQGDAQFFMTAIPIFSAISLILIVAGFLRIKGTMSRGGVVLRGICVSFLIPFLSVFLLLLIFSIPGGASLGEAVSTSLSGVMLSSLVWGPLTIPFAIGNSVAFALWRSRLRPLPNDIARFF